MDSNTRLIKGFQIVNQVTDYGLLSSIFKKSRDREKGKTVTEGGYESEGDMVKCLEDSIISYIIRNNGRDGYELEIPCGEADGVNAKSKDEDGLKNVLHASEIPKAYKDIITDIEIKEVKKCQR